MRAYSILDGKLDQPFDDSIIRPRAMFSETRDGITLYWHQPIDPELREQFWSEIDHYEHDAPKDGDA